MEKNNDISIQAEVYLRLIEHNAKSIANEERLSEQRINFFLILMGGSLALIMGLYGKLCLYQWYWVVIATLGILFIYGLETLNRFNYRVVEKNFFHSQGMLILDKLNDALGNDLAVYRKNYEKLNKKTNDTLFQIHGSPAEFMYLTNSLLLTGIIFFLGLQYQWNECILFYACLATFIGAIIILWKASIIIRNKMSI